ncbi:mCG57114, partial [Mus musculus]
KQKNHKLAFLETTEVNFASRRDVERTGKDSLIKRTCSQMFEAASTLSLPGKMKKARNSYLVLNSHGEHTKEKLVMWISPPSKETFSVIQGVKLNLVFFPFAK